MREILTSALNADILFVSRMVIVWSPNESVNNLVSIFVEFWVLTHGKLGELKIKSLVYSS